MYVYAFVSGALNTECDVSEMGKLTCRFSKNMNSTQTDFSVYFHSDKGHEGINYFLILCDTEPIQFVGRCINSTLVAM